MVPEDATVSLYTLTDTLGIHTHPSDMGKKIIKKTHLTQVHIQVESHS